MGNQALATVKDVKEYEIEIRRDQPLIFRCNESKSYYVSENGRYTIKVNGLKMIIKHYQDKTEISLIVPDEGLGGRINYRINRTDRVINVELIKPKEGEKKKKMDTDCGAVITDFFQDNKKIYNKYQEIIIENRNKEMIKNYINKKISEK